MVDEASKDINKRVIKETVYYVAPHANPAPLLSTALRESSYDHRVDSKNSKDIDAASKSYARNKNTIYQSNPWKDNPSLWQTSRGLFQFIVPNHLLRWDKNADPRVLWHPAVATIVAARLFNRFVDLGAENLCDIRSGWAGGPKYWERDPDYQARCESLRARLKRMGYSPALADMDAEEFGLRPFGVSPQPWDAGVVTTVSNLNNIPDHYNPQWLPHDWSRAYRPPPHYPGSGTVPEDDKDSILSWVPWLSLGFLVYKIAKEVRK